MANDIYAGLKQKSINSKVEKIKEEVENLGFSIVPSYFEENWVNLAREKALNIYKKQEKEFSRETLLEINDHDIARNLVDYDPMYLNLIENEFINNIARTFLGDIFVLSLSNAIINDPRQQNCQARWHRDFPYQNFVADEILGLNIFITLDNFTSENGATEILAHSNKFKELPSDEYIKNHHLKAICPSGSIIIFDSMLLHKAGINHSNEMRVGINLNFVRPFIKQQYEMTKTQYDKNSTLFGSQYFSAKNQQEFRRKRKKD